jgi:FixJ family two-component response regulator
MYSSPARHECRPRSAGVRTGRTNRIDDAEHRRSVYSPFVAARSGCLVCVVDDDVSVRASLERLLSQRGHPVETFDSASAFLRRAPGNAESCLLLDISMPAMDGIELARRLLRDRRPERVVFMSARDEDELSDGLQEFGVTEFVRKPFAPDKLLAAVARARPLGTR